MGQNANEEGINLDDLEREEAEREDEAPDSEPEPAAKVASDEPPQRKLNNSQRRAAAHREQREELETLRKRHAELDEKYNRMEAWARDASTKMIGGNQPRRQEADPIDAELEDVYERQQAIIMRAQSGHLDAEEIKKLEGAARKLDQRKHELSAAKVMRAHERANPRQPQVDPQVAAMQMNYPDVYASRQAITWAQGYAIQKAAREGRDVDIEMVKESFEQARRQFATRPSAPSDAAKAKYAGAGRGAGSAGGGGGGERIVKMGTPEKKMAQALYPDLKSEDAWKKWAKGPGKRLLEKNS